MVRTRADEFISVFCLAIRSGLGNKDKEGKSRNVCYLNASIHMLNAIPQLVELVAEMTTGANAHGELRAGPLGFPPVGKETKAFRGYGDGKA